MNNKSEKKIIKSIFNNFSSYGPRGIDVSFDAEFIYLIVNIGIEKILNDKSNASKEIAEIFDIIHGSNGSIEEFICGVIIAIYGVPLTANNPYIDVGQAINALVLKNFKYGIIVDQDIGISGVFGSANRKIATTFSNKLLEDLILASSMPPKIIIGRNIIRNIGLIEGVVTRE